MYVNSIQIRAGLLSDAELALLGGPSASGIPQALPASNVAGQWDFEFGDLTPTIGSSLAYLDGTEGLTAAGTLFGLTGEEAFVDLPGIGGEPARVMRVPGDVDRNIGYIMEHRIAPNGGGTLVNQYTLIMDVLVATTVVEVGVNVPNATMMVVMDADRFGVSQLHQLRGRVGRGTAAGLCLLVSEAAEGSAARERLDAVAATVDGFRLAEFDLEQRREGDVLGATQSGRRSHLRLLSLLRSRSAEASELSTPGRVRAQLAGTNRTIAEVRTPVSPGAQRGWDLTLTRVARMPCPSARNVRTSRP